jgi:hypothetical protein
MATSPVLYQDPNSTDPFAFTDVAPVIDTGSVSSSSVVSGASSTGSGFDFGGLFSSIGTAVSSGLKASAGPTILRPGSTVLGPNGQLIQVPATSGLGGINTSTLLFLGLGILVAVFLIMRLR